MATDNPFSATSQLPAEWLPLLQQAGLNTEMDMAPAELPGAFVAVIADQCLVRIHGPDTRRFLQGQVTCDVQGLTPEQSLTGAACDPKGRAYGVFQLLALGDDEVLMQLPLTIADAFVAHLQKYLVFFKAEMTRADHWLQLGLHGSSAVTSLAGADAAMDNPGQVRPVAGGFIIASTPAADGTPRHELWLDSQQCQALPPLTAPTLNSGAWRRSRIEAGLVLLTPDTSGAFLPQQLNLHALGGVSFKKGCYTGQEVVARLHFLGKLKKSLFRLRISPATTPIARGEALESPHGKALGAVVDSIQDSDGFSHALAVLSHEVISTGVRLTNNPQIPVTLEPLGYTVADQQPLPLKG
ncbi:MAG: folate-binding protein [Halomonadaceae bacterium]|nr:MAG: folate-binding protein [Halomonadaceae bacterium]